MLCTFEYAARSKAKVNLMAVLAVTENKIGADGFTPDEVLVSLSGKTIEVTNTDAEGRLILLRCPDLCSQKKATRIIDMATLTGACCVSALGTSYTGVFTNLDSFMKELSEASKRSGENIWQLPLIKCSMNNCTPAPEADLVNLLPTPKAEARLPPPFLLRNSSRRHRMDPSRHCRYKRY